MADCTYRELGLQVPSIEIGILLVQFERMTDKVWDADNTSTTCSGCAVSIGGLDDYPTADIYATSINYCKDSKTSNKVVVKMEDELSGL